jgi:hypothetical protein
VRDWASNILSRVQWGQDAPLSIILFYITCLTFYKYV